MSDTITQAELKQAREGLGYSREYVARQLVPPISTKTLERWENGTTDIKGYRLLELQAFYNHPLRQTA